jgi:hypothetical protein
MAMFVLEAIAILVFWVVVDHSRVRVWLPLMITGVFLRYFYQFLLIDWLQIWIIPGSSWKRLWVPITADLTIWPVITMLFIQLMPRPRYRFFYASVFVLGSIGYEQLLVRLEILASKPPWNIGFAFLEQAIFFSVLYILWQWLLPEAKGGDSQ